MMTLLENLKSLGVHVSVQGDSLKIDAPVGALTPELRNRIAKLKTRLMQRHRWLESVRLAYLGKDQNFNQLDTEERAHWASVRMREAHVPGGPNLATRWGDDALAVFGWLQSLALDWMIEQAENAIAEIEQCENEDGSKKFGKKGESDEGREYAARIQTA